MTGGGVDRSVECTGNTSAMISAFECVHDVRFVCLLHWRTNSIKTLWNLILKNFQGWGVAVLVGVPHKDAEFKTHPVNLLNERTLKGTFFGNYKPRSDLPSVVEKYMTGVSQTKPCRKTNSRKFVRFLGCCDLTSFCVLCICCRNLNWRNSSLMK